MNRTKTNEENEWRNASHPRLVERLDNQRKEITRLNAERDAAIDRAEKAEAALEDSKLEQEELEWANKIAVWAYARAEKAEAEAALAAKQEGAK